MRKAMHKGREQNRPEPEDFTQTSLVNEDGSVQVTASFTGRDGELHSRMLTIEDGDDGTVVINAVSGDESRSQTITFSEDKADSGIDIDISCLTSEGEIKSRHIELDMNEDGTLAMEVSFEHDGEQVVHSAQLDLAKFLGEEGEQLTMAEIVESYLERGHIDADSIDLTGINNLTNDAELLVV
jgi:hypothetical protein